jgi:hypothetical protein
MSALPERPTGETGPLTAVVREELSRSLPRAVPPLSHGPGLPAVMTLVCAAAAVATVVLVDLDPTWGLIGVVYAVLLAFGEALVTDRRAAALPVATSPATTMLAIALVLAPSAGLVVGAGLGAAVAAALRDRHVNRVLWAAASEAAVTGVAVATALAFTSPHWGAVAGAVLAALLRMLLTAANPLVRPTVRVGTRAAWALQSLLATAFGLVAARLLHVHPGWAFALPFLAYPAMSDLGHRRAEGIRLAVLAHLEHAATARSPHDRLAAAELVAHAALLVFGEHASVRVISLGPAAPRAVHAGAGGRVDGSLLPAAAGGRPVTATLSGRTRAFASVLGPPDDPVGTLEVMWPGRPLMMRPSRERAARALLPVLSRLMVEADLRARLASASADATSTAGRIAGLAEAGGGTREAIGVLRVATRRIATLGDISDERARADIVAELDRAARALATLVGAVTSATGTTGRPTAVPVTDARPAPALSTPEGRPDRVRLGRWQP